MSFFLYVFVNCISKLVGHRVIKCHMTLRFFKLLSLGTRDDRKVFPATLFIVRNRDFVY
jgi:hypothetical protein